MVAADPLYAAMVDPHCVRFVGIPPGTPALVQSVARRGARIPDQSCPKPEAEKHNKKHSKMRGKKNLVLRVIWPRDAPKRQRLAGSYRGPN